MASRLIPAWFSAQPRPVREDVEVRVGRERTERERE
jgi:hypothetical protein